MTEPVLIGCPHIMDGDIGRPMTPAEIKQQAFDFFLAKILGERIESRDSGSILIAYRWRGSVYVESFEADGLGVK
jgi:hypothetical protein